MCLPCTQKSICQMNSQFTFLATINRIWYYILENRVLREGGICILYAFKEKSMLDNKRQKAIKQKNNNLKNIGNNVRAQSFFFGARQNMPIQCKDKCTSTGQDVLQLKRILNIASGTDINNLMTGEADDTVINLDRGDMLCCDIILENWERFPEINATEINENNRRIIDAQDKALQIKREKLNKFARDKSVEDLKILIRSRGLTGLLSEREQELLEAGKGFQFGDVNTVALDDNSFDEIYMISGFGIKIEGDLLDKIKRLLVSGGTFIVMGNVAVLVSNGLWNRRQSQMIALNGFSGTYLNIDGPWASRHTAGGEITMEGIKKLVYTKEI